MKIRFSNEDRVFHFHHIKGEGIPYLSIAMLDRLGVPNLFSTRFEMYHAETGEGITGLRPAVMAGDNICEAAPIAHSARDRLARQLGTSIEMEGVTDQKHTNHVYVIKEEDLGIRWPAKLPPHRTCVDGVVTAVPGALLTVFGGDCPSVYLADPIHKAIGLVHAGWKGTLQRIPEAAIEQMKEHFGSDPAEMYAAIGPGICKDCYEMGDEVYAAFAEEWGSDSADRVLSRYPATDDTGMPIPGGKYHLDLREANKFTLLKTGIPEKNIAVSNVCTMCNKDIFYSYRGRCMENEQVAMMVNRFLNP